MVNKYTLNDRKMIVKRSRKENKRRLEMNLFRMFMGNLSISNVITIFIRKTCGYAKDVRFFERLKKYRRNIFAWRNDDFSWKKWYNGH